MNHNRNVFIVLFYLRIRFFFVAWHGVCNIICNASRPWGRAGVMGDTCSYVKRSGFPGALFFMYMEAGFETKKEQPV